MGICYMNMLVYHIAHFTKSPSLTMIGVKDA